MTEEKRPSQVLDFAEDVIGFPAFLFGHVFGLLGAILSEWTTFVLFVGAGLIAYATGAPLLVFGGALILYGFLRTIGDFVSGSLVQLNFLAQVIRDKEVLVHLIQTPEFLLRMAKDDAGGDVPAE